jgi:hypothetical protein
VPTRCYASKYNDGTILFIYFMNKNIYLPEKCFPGMQIKLYRCKEHMSVYSCLFPLAANTLPVLPAVMFTSLQKKGF